MKTCTKCNIQKIKSEFGKDKNSNDGLGYWCKKCSTNQSANYRKKLVMIVGHLNSQIQIFLVLVLKKNIISTQKVFEYCLVNLAAWTKKKTGAKNLALSGGGALNRQAVALLTDWHSVHGPKNPGDPGSCIGAVLAKTQQRTTLDNKWYDEKKI